MAKTAMSPIADCRRGATLAELLVALAVLGLMIGLVGPRFTGAIAGADARLAARHTAQVMAEGRARALASGGETIVIVDAGAGEVRVEPAGVTRRLPADVAIAMEVAESEAATNAGGVRFYPDGGATGGVFRFTADGKTWAARVSWITGAAHVERVP
ncbi:MAG: GspH/FimT family pseudopilin [Caulobacterales bacterium]|jgi:general secretion pathway protein H